MLSWTHLDDHGADGESCLTSWVSGRFGSVYHAQYPNELHGVSTAEALKAGAYLQSGHCPGPVAAIILEPVQGEGGFNIAPADFMQALRALCDTHGILLIADEVQSGFARTGKLFSMEHHCVKPDLITMAKSGGWHAALGGVGPRRGDGCACAADWAVPMPVTHWRSPPHMPCWT